MADTSEGWDGTVNEAGMARILAAAAGPRIKSGFLLETVPGQRRVILSAGETSHAFVRASTDTAKIIDLPAPTSGGRWHLIVQRRDWSANGVTIEVLASATTDGADAGLAPVIFPGDIQDTPGVVADFPLYWVWVRASDNLIRWRRVVLPERSYGRSALAEWGVKSGPAAHPGAPSGPYANSWTRGVDSGGTIDAITNGLGIMIGEDGIYDVVARQRVSGADPGTGYIALAVNGNRESLQDRAGGAWFHDHGTAVYTSSESRYLGPLARGELVTAGPAANNGGSMIYGSAPFNGGIWLRRIS